MTRTAISLSLLLFLGAFACTAAWARADQKIRIFVTDSRSWESRTGARPQTAEIIKTFHQKCPQLLVTSNQPQADYVVVLDHEGGKVWLRRDNKVAVFNRGGDAIFSKSVRMLGSAVEEVCAAIQSNASTGTLNDEKPRSIPAPSLNEPKSSKEDWEPFGELKKAHMADLAAKRAAVPKEIKLGMDFAEVEAALGPPATKVDLGQKVLYKYKDMTVEFRDGKVSDVR